MAIVVATKGGERLCGCAREQAEDTRMHQGSNKREMVANASAVAVPVNAPEIQMTHIVSTHAKHSSKPSRVDGELGRDCMVGGVLGRLRLKKNRTAAATREGKYS